jgi:transcription initiation factor IIE alpha subunit
MQTRNLTRPCLAGQPLGRAAKQPGAGILLLWLAALALAATACKKDVAYDAIESDANGYLCLKCGTKLYTDRSVFIGPKCPKCGEDTLIEAIGYYCEKDHHLTIRARRGDPQGAVCEQCGARLVNAMQSPREKDLKAWGATKASS